MDAVLLVAADQRAAFTSYDIIEEALIEALADLGVAEQALTRTAPDPALIAALVVAREHLEWARTLSAARARHPSSPPLS